MQDFDGDVHVCTFRQLAVIWVASWSVQECRSPGRVRVVLRPEQLRDAKAETAFAVGGAARALQNGPSDSALERLIRLWTRLPERDRLDLLERATHLAALRGCGEDMATMDDDDASESRLTPSSRSGQ